MADTPNDIQMAAKASNDAELERLEAELEADLANPNKDQQPESTEPAPTAAEGEKETPAPTSAEGETKPSSEETKPEETKPESKPDGEQKPATETKEEDFTDEDVKHLSEKAQKRFKTMSKRIKEFEAQEAARKYSPAPAKPESPKEPAKPGETPTGLPWDLPNTGQPAESQGQPIDETKVRETVQGELKKKEILDNIKADTTFLEDKYPVLNQDSEEFDEALSTRISSWYKLMFRSNNELRFKDFVEEVMSLRAAGVEKGKTEVTTKVLQQASEQAISPSATRVEPVNVENQISGAKTMSELEALEKSLP